LLKKLLVALLIIVLFYIYGCNKGLGPVSETGFSGTITFVGNWPEGITRTHIVVFKNELKTPIDFSLINLKYISLGIPYGVKTFKFKSTDSSYIPIGSGTYEYVAVVQSKTPDLSIIRSDWFVAGVYYTNGDTSKPGILEIPENTLVENINIVCDFNNPPPQPPGGK
jgi:hypothetical protein